MMSTKQLELHIEALENILPKNEPISVNRAKTKELILRIISKNV